MNKLTKTAVAIMFITLASQSFALKGFKEGEWTDGGNKYCKYSNGVIITIKSHKLCPLSVD